MAGLFAWPKSGTLLITETATWRSLDIQDFNSENLSTNWGDMTTQTIERLSRFTEQTVNLRVLSPQTKYTTPYLIRHSPDRTTFPGYSSRRDAANYNLAFQGRQMRPDSLKFLLSWTNHRPAKRKISKPLVYDQVSSLGSPFALYDPVTVINPDAPKVD